jgi:flagellar biosynthetic protein FliP
MGAEAAETVSLDLGDGSGIATGRIVQIIALITILSLAPSILVMVTSFTRIVIVLSFVRTALGAQQTPPNQVLVSLALFLTLFVMMPTLEQAYDNGIQPLIEGDIDEAEAFTRTVAPLRKFMISHAREQDLALFLDMARQPDDVAGLAPASLPDQESSLPEADHEVGADVPLRVLIPAFMVSELRRAFEIGFLIFVPFLIIDMVVASVLMSMGMMMLPPVIIALPFKLIFFVLVDGWYLVVGSLVRSFGG